VLSQCESALRQRWHASLETSLLDAAEQAIVVVDRAGKVRLNNKWASLLLDRTSSSLLGQTLADFGKDAADRRLLRSRTAVAQSRLTLCVDEVVRTTLATQRVLGDDYGHRLWLFTDLGEQKWQADWRYLEETVNEVARNSRVPLILATRLIENAADLATGDLGNASREVSKLLQRSVQQLRRVDITYERLATTLSIHQEPDQPRQFFDVIVILRQVIAELADDDVESCEAGDLQQLESEQSFVVAGWPEQLGFAFRSLIEHLLSRRPAEEKVEIKVLRLVGNHLEFRFSVSTGGTPHPMSQSNPRDRIAEAEERAREAASLASGSVGRAVERHHGKFWIDRYDVARIVFCIEVPSAPPN
jgi:hypothetical protein